MAASHKQHEISTKYFMGINRGYYVIYLQNMKFVQLILWPGGAYTKDAYTTTAPITIPYYDSFDESRLYRLIMAKPNEPKSRHWEMGWVGVVHNKHREMGWVGVVHKHQPVISASRINTQAPTCYISLPDKYRPYIFTMLRNNKK